MKNRISIQAFYRQVIAAENNVWLYAAEHETYRLRQVEGSPCTAHCPAGVNVKSYVSLIGAGKFKEALAVIRETNPLPGICGRVCTHPCESHCVRKAR